MRIAILHNFIDNIGGAEIVSLTLARELGADIYTTNIDADKIRRMGFEDVLSRIFSIGKVPISAPWRQQIALWRFRRLDLRGRYDFFIIAGDWAMSGAVRNKPNLWYVHSPIREIWDLYPYVRAHLVPFGCRTFFDIWVAFNRYLNRKYIRHVERLVCNSRNTGARITEYLRRPAEVIHPPTQTSRFYNARAEGYWLSVNRMVRHKRVDLQIKAFVGLPHEKLIVVGSYEQSAHFKRYAAYCQSIKPPNVEIRSWVAQEELIELYAHCKGVIASAQDEDFGMSVVEAMAAGKPVIAPEEGGYRETVLHGQTGILVRGMDAVQLRFAIQGLGKELETNPEKYREICQSWARRFDVRIFIEKIKKEMDSGVERTG